MCVCQQELIPQCLAYSNTTDLMRQERNGSNLGDKKLRKGTMLSMAIELGTSRFQIPSFYVY